MSERDSEQNDHSGDILSLLVATAIGSGGTAYTGLHLEDIAHIETAGSSFGIWVAAFMLGFAPKWWKRRELERKQRQERRAAQEREREERERAILDGLSEIAGAQADLAQELKLLRQSREW